MTWSKYCQRISKELLGTFLAADWRNIPIGIISMSFQFKFVRDVVSRYNSGRVRFDWLKTVGLNWLQKRIVILKDSRSVETVHRTYGSAFSSVCDSAKGS
jgi:hypothetical protein